MPVDAQLTGLVEEAFEHLWQSPDHFRSLQSAAAGADADIGTLPLPFFGRIDTAAILTVGVNPATEELPFKNWPEQLTTAALAQRLLTYFEDPAGGFSERFDTWEAALNTLGYSYRDGSAAHIDVSPRASGLQQRDNPVLFHEVCRYDASRLFALLGVLQKPRVLLMAGAVSDDCHINDFLREVARENAWSLVGEGQVTGEGRIGYHALYSENVSYDAFFCSASPNDARNRELLLARVAEHSRWIQMLIPQAEQ